MKKRIKLGLVFAVNDNWIGGTYYILNLVSALKILPELQQPLITVLSKKSSDYSAVQKTGYPFLAYRNPYDSKRSFAEKVIDKLSKIITGKYRVDKRISQKDIDVLFPANNEYIFDRIKNKIYWFADFQHLVLPRFFSAKEIEERNAAVQLIAESNKTLVLSSEAAKADWDTLPFNKNCSVAVIPFAVTHPETADTDTAQLHSRYQINKTYFIVCNQFWAHKDHFTVLKAVSLLKEDGTEVCIVMTGKQDDYRNPGFFKKIEEYISVHGLTANIIMPGLIERKDQLALMKNAIAVIQPSLFEGWSTVIEDARSLGCAIIASDLAVHREQLANEPAGFFTPGDEHLLADKMKNALIAPLQILERNYEQHIRQFGERFFDLMKQVAGAA